MWRDNTYGSPLRFFEALQHNRHTREFEVHNAGAILPRKKLREPQGPPMVFYPQKNQAGFEFAMPMAPKRLHGIARPGETVIIRTIHIFSICRVKCTDASNHGGLRIHAFPVSPRNDLTGQRR